MSGYAPNQGYGEFDPYAAGSDDGNRYNADVESQRQYSQSHDAQDQYSQPQYSQQQYSQPQYSQPQQQPQGGNYEMTQVANDPHAILNQCRDVDHGIDTVESYIDQIGAIHKRLLSDADLSREGELHASAEDLATQTKTLYRSLIERMKTLKRAPDAGSAMNAQQIGRVERRLKGAIEAYQKMQVDFRKGYEEQVARQYRIVRPDATDEEVAEAVEDTGNQQIFSQALIQSDRRGDAQKVSALVRQRHADIQKIERDFEELAQMFQDLNTMIVQQEPAVEQINEQGQTVVQNVGEANVQIDQAITKAKARNRKKWWCVFIAILIIIAIILIVVLCVKLIK
ncbi:Plasma membrane t-SNARE, secretory vesicle fusion [Ascosphaera acerosa]|nr:Plasma membrane t-SNARE, secretory vesicle fusion [Ascosphaera acerosa]